MRPVLYICAPYFTATEIEKATRIEAIRTALRCGWAPVFAPFAYERVLDDAVPEQRELGLTCALSILSFCDAVLVVGDRVTEGMRRELNAWGTEWLHKWPELPEAL